jgi:hypothetical protein
VLLLLLLLLLACEALFSKSRFIEIGSFAFSVNECAFLCSSIVYRTRECVYQNTLANIITLNFVGRN